MRWEVLKQDSEKKPHQAVGSVHGADAEHALLNARHVFGRRPSAVSMWVVREDRIFSRTAEELASHADVAPEPSPDPAAAGERRTFHVFRKANNRRSMTFADHVGDVEATNHAEALAEALDTATTAGRSADTEEPGLAWWVMDAADVHTSDAEAAGSWFEPARDKTYKQQSQYGTVAPSAGKQVTR